MLTDRMACLKGRFVTNIVITAPDYVRFAGHYGFAPDFYHAPDPPSKGIVENLVGYTQRDLAVPLPSLHLGIGPPVVTHKVDRFSCVRFASVRHSVHISG